VSIVPEKRRIIAAETIGLILIAVVILVITLARYGRAIHWGLRK